MAEYDEFGREIPDPTPVEVPLHFRAPPTLQEEIKRYVRSELSRQADEQGFETFEEADDFDSDDDELPFSPHELTEMQEELPRGILNARRKEVAADVRGESSDGTDRQGRNDRESAVGGRRSAGRSESVDDSAKDVRATSGEGNRSDGGGSVRTGSKANSDSDR